MALSRFWVGIFICSIAFIIIGYFSNTHYSLDYFVNGKKDEPILIAEKDSNAINKIVFDSLKKSKENTIVFNYNKKNADTTFTLKNNTIKIYSTVQKTDGILPTCKNTVIDFIIPLIAYLAFFCGLMQLLIDSGASNAVSKLFSPIFIKIFPDVPKNHPSFSYMTLNFAANFLGLDSAATPFGLKAMESLQEINNDKEKASNAQIMFMCLHAAGLTLIPTSIIGYRAAKNSANPAAVMLPCIITSFVGTLAALLIVGFKQRISFKSITLLSAIMGTVGAIVGLLFYINHLPFIEKNSFTNGLSNLLLLGIIFFIFINAIFKEKKFTELQTNIFDSFVTGAGNGLKTGLTIFPYILGMMVAISLFRNSGLFEIIANGIASFFSMLGVQKNITDALPVALLRPFSSGGSRGFMLDAMQTYGADSFTGFLSCIFQCSAETTFYVIAMYFGSIKIRNTRYTLSTMLLVDLICVLTAIFVSVIYFKQ